MADITVVPASVLASNGASVKTGIAGATITAGQTLFVDTADSNKLKLADNNLSAAAALIAGIALHGAASGQPLQYVEEDPDFTPGATLTTGTIYAASSTAGGIAPVADLTTGHYPTVLFVAKSTSKAVMRMVRGGVAI
jgi:hydrogenase/urease accessory protein HupE